MLDIGWSEMALIALLALIVIGPKDLPRVMRTVGQWVRKARGFARDFQSSLDEMIQDDELREAKRTIETETRNYRNRGSFGIGKELEKHVDSTGDVRRAAEDLEQSARASDDTQGTARPALESGRPAPTSPPSNGAAEPARSEPEVETAGGSGSDRAAPHSGGSGGTA